MTMGNGVLMTAHFEPSDAYLDQTCCTETCWMQRLSFTDAAGQPRQVPGAPNRPFIDPRMGQVIDRSTTPPGVGDNMPCYDLTYDEDPVPGTAVPISTPRGGGTYISDKPFVDRVISGQTIWPITVCFETLLMCKLPNMTYAIIGGFSWGFTISENPNQPGSPLVMPKGVLALSESVALKDSFNAALMQDFPGSMVICASPLWPDPLVVTVVVPGPGSGMLLVGALVCAARRRRACRT